MEKQMDPKTRNWDPFASLLVISGVDNQHSINIKWWCKSTDCQYVCYQNITTKMVYVVNKALRHLYNSAVLLVLWWYKSVVALKRSTAALLYVQMLGIAVDT